MLPLREATYSNDKNNSLVVAYKVSTITFNVKPLIHKPVFSKTKHLQTSYICNVVQRQSNTFPICFSWMNAVRSSVFFFRVLKLQVVIQTDSKLTYGPFIYLRKLYIIQKCYFWKIKYHFWQIPVSETYVLSFFLKNEWPINSVD